MSAQANCDIEKDLLSSGWTDPYSTSAAQSETSSGTILPGQGNALSSHLLGQGNRLSSPENTRSIEALQAYVAMLVDLAQVDGCCDGGFPGDIGSLGLPLVNNNVTDDTNTVSTVFSGSAAASSTAMIPEPSISYLLLIGIGGLVLTMRKRASGRGRIA